ncbi:hypothetical protein [Loktanella sp. SALINAS62]|uniref:hypothetical protein n=1 Tax=Loktanella sp. SALINAS62 TaxID=2706124 RepID=UPI001B8B3CC2|nr:hypothetical protein [Loktanella sp. SALINAS62]MBS1301553.1 hypothetical protein [Loktanella sp. SALINAS62]
MTDASTDAPLPAEVAEIAKAKETLDLNRLALIGLRLAPDGNRALVRTAAGEIASLSVGDQADNLTVTAVTETGLHLIDRKGFARTLTMPG